MDRAGDLANVVGSIVRSRKGGEAMKETDVGALLSTYESQ